MRRRRVALLLTTMLAALIMSSGVAYAVNKVCPSGSSSISPCNGTAKTRTASGNDTLIGTSGTDYILALSGNDKISAGAGNDYTNGSSGNDTYSYKSGWGTDTVVDASGVDTLNFSAVTGGIGTELFPDYTAGPQNHVNGPAGERVDVSSTSIIEKVVGSASGNDNINTGGAANILQPGPGTGGAFLTDVGGCNSTIGGCSTSIPVSNDTYSGLSASGYGPVTIEDYGGTADKLILPFASTDAYFEAYDVDGDGSADTLLIMSTSTDSVKIYGQLEPYGDIPGHIEYIQFTDGNFSIGSASATTSAPATNAPATSTSPTSQVDALNAASTLSASEKDKLKKAAKKVAKKAPSPPTSPEDAKAPKK